MVRGLLLNNRRVTTSTLSFLCIQAHIFPAWNSHLPSTLEKRKNPSRSLAGSSLPTGNVGFSHTGEGLAALIKITRTVGFSLRSVLIMKGCVFKAQPEKMEAETEWPSQT